MSVDVRARTVVVLLIGLVLALGCTRTPEARKAAHLERGERYASQGKHGEAIVEFRNVLKLDAENPRAHYNLGLAHHALGEFSQAYRYLLKSQELEPHRLDVRQKLGEIFLAGGKLDEARAEAEFILDKNPKNLGGLLLLAGSTRTKEEAAASIERLEAAKASFGDQPRLWTMLGSLYAARQDWTAAEAHFRQAVEKDPKSIEARTILGNFFVSRRNLEAAEAEYKAAAAIAPVGSPARLRLADFYVTLGRRQEAKDVLAEITGKAPGFLPAWRRVAELAFAERRYDDAATAIDHIIKKSPRSLDAQLFRGRIQLAKGSTTDAIQNFQRVLKSEPKFTQARLALAEAYLYANNVQQAKTELAEAVRVTPNSIQARLALADLNLKTGAPQPVIEDLEKLVKEQPRLGATYLMLGKAYMSARQPAKAAAIYRRLMAEKPQDAGAVYLLGLALQAQGQNDEARAQFEKALTLHPGAVDPLRQLAALDLRRNDARGAVSRVTRVVEKNPDSAPLQQLLADVSTAVLDYKTAEAAYLKAIAIQPRHYASHLRLSMLYMQSGKAQEALDLADKAARLLPGDPTPHWLRGIVSQRQGDVTKAREEYERALAVNPRFPPAANNLAWLLAEHGGDKEKALQLAQVAKEALPEDPNVNDTLGWVLYKRGVYDRATRVLAESASKLPGDPLVQYHFGMASLKSGDKAGARRALEAALKPDTPFPGRDEAQKTLAELK